MAVGVGSARRIFSSDKVVSSKALNVLGAQVFRTLVARIAYNLRRIIVPPAVAGEVAELRREGIVVWRDFLPRGQFERVRAECARLDGRRDLIERFTHGSTTLEVIELRNVSDGSLHAIGEFYDDPRLCGIFTAAEQRPLGSLAQYGKLEYLTHGEPGADMDPQTALHSDIFFNTHKAWLYLHDVRIEDGPLVYVRGSHRLTLPRLLFMYRDSWTRYAATDPSRRISPAEQRQLQVQETVVTCPANTLVVVNTSGYHRRFQGRPGATRYALHLSVRSNPFGFHRLRARLSGAPRVYNFLRRVKRAWRP
jgi:phytanoyl-CoA dioxygenase PhyH